MLIDVGQAEPGRTIFSRLFVLGFGLSAALTASAQPPVPEILYYNFNESGTTVTNHASSPPSGTATATITGAVLTQNNAFSDTAQSLLGTGTSSANDYVNTNWATNLSGSWTLSFATTNIAQSTSTYYILGDVNASGFRCFSGGVAGVGNWILRGPVVDVLAAGGAGTTPHVTTFVYDQSVGTIQAYVDATLVSTVIQSAISVSSPGPFKVGGYSSSANLNGKMADFRFYSRALTQSEITDIYNYDLHAHFVGGTASGITRTGLVLQNNAGDDLAVDADGTFTFATPLLDASTYDVTVSAPPGGQTCDVTNGSGTISGANVTDIAVNCTDTPTNLVLTVDDGSPYAAYGQTTNYMVTLTNTGGISADNVTVGSAASIGLAQANAIWTCTPAGGATCTANGSGPFGDTVSVPFNGSLTWIVSIPVFVGATGNTVEFDVSAPGTVVGDIDTLVIFRDGFGD